MKPALHTNLNVLMNEAFYFFVNSTYIRPLNFRFSTKFLLRFSFSNHVYNIIYHASYIPAHQLTAAQMSIEYFVLNAVV